MSDAADPTVLRREHWDAVVIGAGPAGSIAAHSLARIGHSVLLVDRARFPRAKVCGGCLNARALAVLDEASLSDRVWSAGAVPISEFRVSAGATTAMIPLPGGAAISRAALDEQLATAAVGAGASFVDGSHATIMDSTRDAVRIRIHSQGVSKDCKAGVCIVATGLSSDSIRFIETVGVRTAARARVGCGTTLPEPPADLPAGQIRMAVARGGYVGLVRVEHGSLIVAAAIDPRLMREFGSPAAAVRGILQRAGTPIPGGLDDATWRGTPPLTRRARPVAAERLFIVGDAAGYVEPFTGEGMAWALESGVAAARLAHRQVKSWEPGAAAAWDREYARIAARAQRRCRAVALALRRPTLVHAAVRALGAAPGLARPIVYSLNAPTHREEFAP